MDAFEPAEKELANPKNLLVLAKDSLHRLPALGIYALDTLGSKLAVH
jgi:hypothetical protein